MSSEGESQKKTEYDEKKKKKKNSFCTNIQEDGEEKV